MMNCPALRNSMVTDPGVYLKDNDNGAVNPSIVWDADKVVLRGTIIARKALLSKR